MNLKLWHSSRIFKWICRVSHVGCWDQSVWQTFAPTLHQFCIKSLITRSNLPHKHFWLLGPFYACVFSVLLLEMCHKQAAFIHFSPKFIVQLSCVFLVHFIGQWQLCFSVNHFLDQFIVVCPFYTNSSLSPSSLCVGWLAVFTFTLLSVEWFNLCARANCLLAAAAWLPAWQSFQQLQLPNTGMSLFLIDNWFTSWLSDWPVASTLVYWSIDHSGCRRLLLLIHWCILWIDSFTRWHKEKQSACACVPHRCHFGELGPF